MAGRPGLRWLELAPDYRCNNRCLGCFAVSDAEGGMDALALARALAAARADGARELWLGGGEPTLRRDLLGIVKRARALGFTRVKLQTNGMLLAYPELVDKLAGAGLTEVSFSIKGATAGLHDELTRTPGSFELMLTGMENARRAGLELEGDVLVYRRNLTALPEVVRYFHERGVARFRMWMLSHGASAEPEVAAEVPRFDELAPQLEIVAELGLSTAPDFVSSLHTPGCVLPEAARGMVFSPRELRLRVVDAAGHGFMLEDSPMEGGTFLTGCEACALRARCGGFRADYLRLHGEPARTPLRAEGHEA